MIQANELRIGNLIKEGEVSSISEDEITLYDEESQEYYEFYYKSINPIELTEEWLLKAGFEGNSGYRTLNKMGVLLKEVDPFNENGRVYYNSWAIINNQPKHVHQLQNLYFALTGEELVFNL